MPPHDDDSIDNYAFEDYQNSPDDVETVRCTRCKKHILEDSERCPYCGHYQLADERNRKPLWFVVTVVVCVILCALIIGGIMSIYPWP